MTEKKRKDWIPKLELGNQNKSWIPACAGMTEKKREERNADDTEEADLHGFFFIVKRKNWIPKLQLGNQNRKRLDSQAGAWESEQELDSRVRGNDREKME